MMHRTRRHTFMLPLAAAAVPAAMPRSVVAQPERWPSRPIMMIVPFGAGGGTDILARLLAQQLAQSLGQAVPVDNRGGATGTIGMAALARARADGYTIAIAPNGTYAMATALYDRLPYDPERAFAPVTMLATTPIFLCVHPSAEWRSVSDLMTSVKARPGQITYASAGAGSTSHIFVEQMLEIPDMQMLHVSYRSGVQAAQAVMQREAATSFVDASIALPYMRSGELRALAITSASRSAQAPDVPTIAENGLPGYSAIIDFALFAPAGTPQPILDRLAVEANAALRVPEMAQRLTGLAMDPAGGTPAEFAVQQAAEIRRWSNFIRRRGIRLE